MFSQTNKYFMSGIAQERDKDVKETQTITPTFSDFEIYLEMLKCQTIF